MHIEVKQNEEGLSEFVTTQRIFFQKNTALLLLLPHSRRYRNAAEGEIRRLNSLVCKNFQFLNYSIDELADWLSNLFIKNPTMSPMLSFEFHNLHSFF